MNDSPVQDYASLPDDPTFTPWVGWQSRLSIPGRKLPGVYLLAHFGGEPPHTSDPLAADVFYIGMTCKTLSGRWTGFAHSATTGKPAHCAGRSYFKSFGSTKVDSLHVSAYPVPLHQLGGKQFPAAAYIQYIERKLLWKYFQRHKTLPKCNKI